MEAPRPAALDRRFEAVVFDWDGTAVADRRADAGEVRALVEDLCGLGVHVAVVSGTHVGNVDGQLAARPDGPGRLLLALNRGSETFEVGAGGPVPVHRRRARPDEEEALDRAAEKTRAALAERGLRAEIVSSRLNRRKIDLLPEPAWADPPKARIGDVVAATHARLAAAGVEGLPAVVDLAAGAAREAGLAAPRVTSDAKHVEIGLTDKSDAMQDVLARLWAHGVGPSLVLVAGDEFGSLGGLPGSDDLMRVPAAADATFVSVGAEPSGVPAGVHAVPGGPPAFVALLRDQLHRRRAGEVPRVDARPGWCVLVDGFDLDRERARGAMLAVGDGVVATTGAPVVERRGAASHVFVAGVYDGEGPHTHLLRAPSWDRVPVGRPPGERSLRILDLRTAVLADEHGPPAAAVRAVRFHPLGHGGGAVLRLEAPSVGVAAPLVAPELAHVARGHAGGVPWMAVAGTSGGVTVAARDRVRRHGDRVRLDRLAAYVRHDGAGPRVDDALGRLQALDEGGFDRRLTAHRRAWSARWEDADVEIHGDDELQERVRLALFHLMAAVDDRGEAAVGARGLTGTGYRGHVFWDADVFVLPFLAATHPAAARAMLEYRVRRLPAARAAARALGRAGARFPWESAATGHDVTPRSARDRTGRVVPIRCGLLEDHVVADVAWAAAHYVDWTGDDEFARGPGRALLVETARYWASRVRVAPDGTAHVLGVIGPDEYHEPVDDDAFTNVMARWNLRRAAAAVAAGGDGPGDPAEADRWLGVAGAIVDGRDPVSGVYEQFAGFRDLEPLLIAEVAPRRPVAADAVLGRERVAAAQVVKQADVLMAHHLVPDEMAPGSLPANLRFYEPRTAHGSSLSPGIHAALHARVGDEAAALDALRLAAAVDPEDLTGTTAAGVHLATAGSVWQAIAFGFAGVRPVPGGDRLVVDPVLPAAWPGFSVTVRFRGSRVRLRREGPDAAVVEADPPVPVRAGGHDRQAGPEGLRVRLSRRGREVDP